MQENRYTGTPQLMKRINKSMVLDLVKRRDAISRADIAKELHLSPPTVSKIVDQLVDDGWITEMGIGESSGGRRPLLLQFNARHGYVIGSWVGDTSLIASVADMNGEIILKRVVNRRSAQAGKLDSTGSGVIPLEQELILLMYRTLKEAGIPADKLRGIGVAVCGITSIEKGTVVRGRYLPGWEDFPIQQVLEDEFSVPVVADGDTFMAVLGEAWRGAGRGLDNLVRVTLGDGIGCGILIGGKPYRGFAGAAGEIGDMIVHDELGESSRADKGGYLEEVAGLSSLVIKAQRAIEAGATSMMTQIQDEQMTPESVLQAAVMGDHLAVALVRALCATLGRAIANIISVLNPEQVILGGELGPAGELVLAEVSRDVKELLATPPPMGLSTLGRDAELYGAISLALERVTPAVEVNYAPGTL